MAKIIGVWGIDIGRCALKALRCRLDGDSVVADAFDYIEYPKLLSQPEADPVQLVKEALEQFLSRNTVKGDRVAISVSGESGLARYFKPPPVDAKKIADLVKFEARQQIPFALEDVIWDYQRMAGGQEADGFVLESEIGLFAMKREQVAKAMAPFKAAGVEVDIIQLAPIAVYNYIAYDYLKPLPEGQEYSSEDPPPSSVLLSIGTETTDLVITNGYRVWQRNIPLGGNHFTKQLSKDLKLTFAKAEHLKRNPRQADDPKAIFQAMRPVFGDLVTEVQRSVGFFQSLDRKAKITSAVLLGNTAKLPGLGQYLSKHLGYDVKEIDSYNKLTGSGVVSAPAFRDNVLTYATCYGLCLQGLGQGKLSTNLLPREIMTERMIRAKKPWAVAALGTLVLGLGLNWVFWYRTYEEVHPDHTVNNVKWTAALDESKQVQEMSGRFQTEDKKKLDQLKKIDDFSREVVGTSDRRVLWLELLKAIDASLPRTPLPPGGDLYKVPIGQRRELHIEYIETEFFDNLDKWWKMPKVKQRYLEVNPDLQTAASGTAPAASTAPPPSAPSGGGQGMNMGAMMSGAMGGGAAASTGAIDVSNVNVAGPTGPGWVVELKGYHYFNEDASHAGAIYVKETLMKMLEHGAVKLPVPGSEDGVFFTMDELGIGYVILSYDPRPVEVKLANPNAVAPEGAKPGAAGFGAAGAPAPAKKEAPKEDPNNPEFFTVRRYDFIVQFVWQEKPLNVRIEEKAKKAAEAAAKAAAAPAATPGQTPAPPAAAPVSPAGTAPTDAQQGAPPATNAPPPSAGGPNSGAQSVPPGSAPPANVTPPAAPVPVAPSVPEVPEADAPTGPAAPPADSPAPAAKG